MASYFDDHDCEPLNEGEAPSYSLLELARLLARGGFMELANILRDTQQEMSSKPPASTKFVEELKKVQSHTGSCSVCLAPFEGGNSEDTREMPCAHRFHARCIIPWLTRTNTCPVCRREVPTDDELYEQCKAEEAEEQDKKERLDSLHNSMYG